jgi:hypothetical protein
VPAVSDQPLVDVEKALLEDLSLTFGGSPYDELDRSLVARRLQNFRQARFELLGKDVRVHLRDGSEAVTM